MDEINIFIHIFLFMHEVFTFVIPKAEMIPALYRSSSTYDTKNDRFLR